MDIISHGLWGGVSAGRKNRKNFFIAFFFGVLPDLLSFGIFTPLALFGFVHGIDWKNGPPPPEAIPSFVYNLYDITHSLVIFSLIFFIVWIFLGRPFFLMIPWGLHIIMDIFSHSYEFFPTPFLWPISDFMVDAIPWSDARIMIPNIILLFVIYGIWFFNRRRSKNIG